jgi:hypothetical protein
LLDGLFASKTDQLLFAINDQIGNLGNAVDAFDDGVLATTAFDVFNFNLERLCHDMFLLKTALQMKVVSK